MKGYTIQLRKRTAAIFAIALFLLLTIFTGKAYATQYESNGGIQSNNMNYEGYGNWYYPIDSYLISNNDGTYTRIEADETGSSPSIVWEKYSSNYQLLETGTINAEGELFGGFCSGSNYNYFLFGNTNSAESNTKEVYIIVKYSKSWQRIGKCAVINCNTTIPFDAGSARFAEYGNMLYIHTSREMYTSSDGKNHQSNFMIQVDTSSMTVKDYTKNLYVAYGYVSHSFNQFVKIDGTDIVTLDHGDAYNRGLCITKHTGKAGQSSFFSPASTALMMSFPGDTGANYTGCEIGGFDVSGSAYIATGVYNGTDSSKTKNLFIATMPKSSFNTSSAAVTYHTSYEPSDNVRVYPPQLVKISNTRFMLIWETADNSAGYSSIVNKIHYMLIDGNGNPVTSEQVVAGSVSDCLPIVSGNKIVWYYTNNTSPIFVEIPIDGGATTDNGIAGLTKYMVSVKRDGAQFKNYAVVFGTDATINAPDSYNGKGFDYWKNDENNIINSSNRENAKLVFIMPGKDIVLDSVFSTGYNVTVTGGTGTGLYVPGKSVTVKLNSISSSKYFDHWDVTGLTLTNEEKEESTLNFTMPNNNVSLSAVIGDRVNIYSDCTVNYTSYHEYTGKPIEIEAFNETITNKNTGEILVRDRDYTVSPDTAYEVGSGYWVAFTGIRKYSSGVRWSYRIVKRSLSNTDITVSPVTAVYSGNQNNPSVVIKNGDLTLSEGTDYTVSKTGDFTSAGNHQIKLTGAGTNYTGTSTQTFIITAKPLSDSDISVDNIAAVTYNGSAQTPTVTVRHGSRTLTQGTDYTLSYKNNTNAGTATVTITGIGNYSGTKTKTFTINPKALTNDMVNLSEDSVEYSGSSQKPTVTVKAGNTPLTENTDYTLVNTGGTNVGTYSVSVTGKGNYSGTITREFTISKKAFTANMISFNNDSFVYNSTTQKPEVTVKLDSTILNEGTDYTLINNGGISAGTYKVTVQAKNGGNFTGSAEKSYTIAAKVLGSEMVIMDNARFTYNGEKQGPQISVMDGSTKLIEGSDYNITNCEGVNAADYVATITGAGNYSGKVYASFTIEALAIDATGISVDDITAVTYNGSAITPAVNVKYGTKTLTQGTDYTLSGSNNTNVGTAKVMITGIGNYTGSRDGSFDIKQRDISSSGITVSNISNQIFDDGAEIKPEVSIKDGSRTLTKGKDYTVSYSDNTEIGTATVNIEGIGNYTGNRSTTFNIVEAPEPPAPDPGSDPVPVPGSDPNQKGEDGTEVGPGASEAAAEKAITGMKTDGDPKGSVYSLLQLKSTKQANTSITLKWTKPSGAVKFVLYGNKCGKTNKMKRLATYTGKSKKITKVAGKKLKKGTYYKFIMVALDKNNNVVSTSKVIHIATKGGKVANHKSVTAKKTSLTLSKGKTIKVGAKQIGTKVKKHRTLSYESSDKKVATVDKNGKIKGVNKGTCYVYAYAQNGISKKVKVTVK